MTGLRVRLLGAGILITLILVACSAAAAPDFPKLTGRVVDNANMLDSAAQSKLRGMLAALEKKNGDQVVVVTLPDLGGHTIENYGYQLGRSWGIGDKHKNNGALLIIAKAEHKIRIEVGYGLEGRLTDAQSSIIIHQIIEPAFKQGDFNQGVLKGASAIIRVLGGNPLKQVRRPAQQQHNGVSFGHTLFFFLLIAAIIGLFGGGGGGGPGGRRRRRSRMPWFVPIGGLGGTGGGFGGGTGGGFSGGGGSFGGGGASGGW